MAEIDRGITSIIDTIIDALTKPLTEEEESPKPKKVEKIPRIAFKGNIEEVNRFFYRRGWTDGLPIIPPTETAVAEMLTGTVLLPEHVVSKIIPRLGKATVEKIAVNAVMAGALPTHMPVLIACIQAVMDPACEFGTFEVSTGSWAPCFIINGPVRSDLHINSGSGAMSPGDIANAAIGRAMGLIIKNIGGARKGVEDMGTMGNALKYSLVFAENEEESPWEPLHVERGFNREDSVVTVFFPNYYGQKGGTSVSEARQILSTIVYHLVPEGLSCLILTPEQAKRLAAEDYSKSDVKTFISENTTIPFYRHREFQRVFQERGVSNPKILPLYPEDPIRVMRDPANLLILVAGGAGSFMALLKGGGQMSMGITFASKKIGLPPNWNQLVEKYKDIKPTYALY
jgi:hypothetical protein